MSGPVASHAPQDFAERQAHNRRMAAAVVFLFLVFFFLVGLSVDYLYLDAFTPAGPAFPLATVLSLGLATAMTLASYYGGSELITLTRGGEVGHRAPRTPRTAQRGKGDGARIGMPHA